MPALRRHNNEEENWNLCFYSASRRRSDLGFEFSTSYGAASPRTPRPPARSSSWSGVRAFRSRLSSLLHCEEASDQVAARKDNCGPSENGSIGWWFDWWPARSCGGCGCGRCNRYCLRREDSKEEGLQIAGEKARTHRARASTLNNHLA